MSKKKQKKKKARKNREFVPFTRDWMFAAVTRDPGICKGLLEVILPDENIEKIEIATPDNPVMDDDFEVTPEAMLKFAEDIHGVRFENGLVPINIGTLTLADGFSVFSHKVICSLEIAFRKQVKKVLKQCIFYIKIKNKIRNAKK